MVITVTFLLSSPSSVCLPQGMHVIRIDDRRNTSLMSVFVSGLILTSALSGTCLMQTTILISMILSIYREITTRYTAFFVR